MRHGGMEAAAAVVPALQHPSPMTMTMMRPSNPWPWRDVILLLFFLGGRGWDSRTPTATDINGSSYVLAMPRVYKWQCSRDDPVTDSHPQQRLS